MKQLTRLALILLTAGLLSSQVYASSPQTRGPIAVFNQTDINLMFEPSNSPMQLATLSRQEMKETEGAWWRYYMYFYAPRLSAAGWSVYQAAPYMRFYHFRNLVEYYWHRR